MDHNHNTILKIKQLAEKLDQIDNRKFSDIYRIWSIEKEIEKLELSIAKNPSSKTN